MTIPVAARRLVDVEVVPGPDGFPEFIDTLSNQTAPYLYLSSNGGRGYDTEGGWVFHHQVGLANGVWNRNLPYRQTVNGPRWNAKSFQIISPGFGPHERILPDGTTTLCPYGVDEVYDPENVDSLSVNDADNITNFSAGGRMRP